jgi:hypothetical protein
MEWQCERRKMNLFILLNFGSFPVFSHFQPFSTYVRSTGMVVRAIIPRNLSLKAYFMQQMAQSIPSQNHLRLLSSKAGFVAPSHPEGFKDWVGQNKRIIEYEKTGDWRGLIRYAGETKKDFNDVNWATMFSKLGRMKREAKSIKSDAAFIRLREDFERILEEDGMGWLGMQVRMDKNLISSTQPTLT